MALGVLNNLSAIYAEHNLNNTNSSLQTILQQMLSGSRINSGADDSAGLSLVNGLAANSAALTQSTTNVSEGVGLLQVADGALSQVTSLLDRAVTLATEASNGTLNTAQDGAANNEYQSILAEINNIGSTTTYNQQSVFSGNATILNGSVATSVGPLTGTASTSSSYYSIGISGNITDTSTAVAVGNTTTYGGTANVGITADSNGAGGIAAMGYSDSAGQSLSGTDLLDQSDAQSALNELNVAITDAAAQDGYIGAQINTLNSISQVMSTQQENVLSAQNAIQATDYASATSNMSKYEILSQTGIAALAQANSVQQEVTKLLR